MAFNSSSLEQDLLSVFNSMTDGDNRVFAQGISNALKSFIDSGTPSTSDSGTIATGVFTGASTSGSMTATASSCQTIIYNACQAMIDGSKDNDYIAKKIAEGLKAMTDGTIVVTSVSGNTVPPSPPPPSIPTSGSAQGGIDCDVSSVETGLKTCFTTMKSMTTGGNAYFASQFASLVDTCLKAGEVSTEGIGNLAGSSGSGRAT